MQTLVVSANGEIGHTDNNRMTAAYNKYRHNTPNDYESLNAEETDLEEFEDDDEQDKDDDDDIENLEEDEEQEEEEEEEEVSDSSPEAADEGLSSSSEVVLPFSWYKDQLSHPVYAHQTHDQLQQDEPSSVYMNDEANEPSEPT